MTEAAKVQAELFEYSLSELSTDSHPWREYQEQQQSEPVSNEWPSRDATDRALVDFNESLLTDDLLAELTAVISS